MLFEGGRPYLLSNMSAMSFLSHHTGLMLAHLRLFEALSEVCGVAWCGVAQEGEGGLMHAGAPAAV